MEGDGLEPDEAAYCAAISACKSAGEIERVFEVLDFMDLRGHSPSTAVYALAFAACLEHEAWDVLPFLLKRMEGHETKADADFFDHLVRLLGGDTPRPGPFLSKRLLQQHKTQKHVSGTATTTTSSSKGRHGHGGLASD